jgi:hypothetical protein
LNILLTTTEDVLSILCHLGKFCFRCVLSVSVSSPKFRDTTCSWN